MDDHDRIVALATLAEGATCELCEDYRRAVDFLVVPMGYRETSICSRQTGEHMIPVCQPCAESLHCGMSDKWILFYCLTCCSPAWIHQSSKFYDRVLLWFGGLEVEKVNWMYECPECWCKKD